MISKHSALKDWLNRETKRKDKYVSLAQALWCGQELRYVIYRFRYILLSALMLLAYHVTEVSFLYYSHAHYIVVNLFIFKIVILILGAFWWGFTEVLRSKSRLLAQLNCIDKIITLRKIWSFWGWIVGLFAFGVICILITQISLDAEKSATAVIFYYVYILVISLEMFVTFPLRTMHSSIYGRKRVYKPFLAIIAPTILSFLMMVVLWQPLGLFAILLSQLSHSIFSLILSYAYTIKMLKKLNEADFSALPLMKYLNAFKTIFTKESIAAGVSYSAIQAEGALLIILLLWTFQAQIFTLYAIVPIISIGYALAITQYFDLKKMPRRWQSKLYAYVNKYYLLASICSCIFFWLCTLPIAVCFRFDLSFSIYLFCFFLIRAVLSYFQIRAYAAREYLKLIVGELGFITIILVLLYLPLITIWVQLGLLLIGAIALLLWLIATDHFIELPDHQTLSSLVIDKIEFLSKKNHFGTSEHPAVFKLTYDDKISSSELLTIIYKLNKNHNAFLVRSDHQSAYLVVSTEKNYKCLLVIQKLFKGRIFKTHKLSYDALRKIVASKCETTINTAAKKIAFNAKVNSQELPKEAAQLFTKTLFEHVNYLYPNQVVRVGETKYLFRVIYNHDYSSIKAVELTEAK